MAEKLKPEWQVRPKVTVVDTDGGQVSRAEVFHPLDPEIVYLVDVGDAKRHKEVAKRRAARLAKWLNAEVA